MYHQPKDTASPPFTHPVDNSEKEKAPYWRRLKLPIGASNMTSSTGER